MENSTANPAASLVTQITEVSMSAATVHVEANRKGRWIVRHEDERQPLSEHESASEAQRVACELARLEGTSGVVLHDRYARIRHVRTDVPPGRNVPPRPG